jgi:rhodanese-related sulfurtransferase/DNA-binding HxlR family transcriptional regulator
MADRHAKDALYDAFAEVAKALASGRRAEIVDVLAQGPRAVEEIANEIDQSMANTSHHLRNLARAGLVRGDRRGVQIIYRLASDTVAELWANVRQVAAQHSGEIDRLARTYLGDRDELEAVTREELQRRMRRGDITVIDVRPLVEYRAGHIAGARPVPPAELDKRLRGMPGDADVVAYCRGPYCVYADTAVRTLTRRGVRARRLEDGFPEWKRAGLPVAEGDEEDVS